MRIPGTLQRAKVELEKQPSVTRLHAISEVRGRTVQLTSPGQELSTEELLYADPLQSEKTSPNPNVQLHKNLAKKLMKSRKEAPPPTLKRSEILPKKRILKQSSKHLSSFQGSHNKRRSVCEELSSSVSSFEVGNDTLPYIFNFKSKDEKRKSLSNATPLSVKSYSQSRLAPAKTVITELLRSKREDPLIYESMIVEEVNLEKRGPPLRAEDLDDPKKETSQVLQELRKVIGSSFR